MDARLVPTAVAATFDLGGLPGQQIIDALIDFLAPRSLLLVIDNCEHLLAATTELAGALLRCAPALTIIATSREPLRIPGEVVFRVPSLAIANPEQTLEPRELLRYEAVQLFVDRAASVARGFTLDEGNAVDVARICFRLDGLPLALELAAGRLGGLGPAAIADRLDDRFRVLRALSGASPTRQHTLTATLQWSHDLLQPDERELFRRLAAFAGGFELEAVESVCAGGVLAAEGIADVLARLVEKSLVTADHDFSRERRYGLLETVRLYARERLDESGETSAVVDRHAAWALALAEDERDSRQLEREAANLRVALDTLLERSPPAALRLCVALEGFWMRRIDLVEAQRRLDEALSLAPERTDVRAQALLAAAAIDFRSGVLARGLRHAEESYSVASDIGDPRAQWRALQFLGEFGVASDAADVAIPWLERALELARREGYAAAEAICVYSLGVAQWILGELDRSEELLTQSIELFGALAGSPERIPSPVNIAEIRTSLPDGRAGLRVVFEDTLQPFDEISCDAAVGYVLANQAGIVRGRGDLARARALLDESQARFENADDRTGKAAVLVRRAYLELAGGALPSAREALHQALVLRRELGDRRGLGLALAGLGLIDTRAGDHRSAERHLAEACDIFRRAGDRWGLAGTLWRIADLAFARGSLDDAETALQEARAVLDVTRRDRWIAHTLAGLAEVALLQGDEERGTELLLDARERYAARNDALGVADVERRLDGIAKDGLSARKEAADTTDVTFDPKGRRR